ncbi:MAG: TM0106 family RecB-like putative nuclease [Gemmatimonadaceae bacterium]|nr:TM0106 family RecB-like putative nuclease [Gemmatimonadaceae bacterium]
MRHTNGSYTLSASDLAAFLGCAHRTALDMAVATGARERLHEAPDPLLDALIERGKAHEARYVEALRARARGIVDLSAGTFNERHEATRQAMRDGVEVIVQGALADGEWMGYPDILQRMETASGLGEWSYEVEDTKLSRETRAGTILQLALYSDMLATVQGAVPQQFHVITPDPVAPRQSYRVNDYAAYVRLVRAQLLDTVAQDWDAVATQHYPEPVDQCDVCKWYSTCKDKRRADDHLSLVAGIARVQRRELESRDVRTLTSLARMPLPIEFKPQRGSKESYVRVREQARLQLESRDLTTPLYETLPVVPGEGLCRLPEQSPGDLFLDLEGDPFAAEGGREYLFGLVAADGRYQSRWAFTEHDEKIGFEWVMDEIAAALQRHPDMHVYHYAPYEPAAFKRLMGRHATRERELDAMLRSGRFVDLYGVIRQGVRAGIERYSIKNLEPLYGYTREVALADANRSLRVMELGLMTQSAHEVPVEVRDVVEGYNTDDCVSTLRLRDWLETVRTQVMAQGTEVPRPTPEDGAASDKVDEKAQRVEALRERLLDGVPTDRLERDAETQGRWILAYLLDYHRREDKATWWEFFRLCELPEEDLLDEREAVAGLTLVGQVGTVARSVIDRYSYPTQEMEIGPDDEVRLQDEKVFGTVQAVDRVHGTIDVKKGPSRANIHPSAMFEFRMVKPDVMEGALLRIGESVANGGTAYGAARSLLAAHPPVLSGQSFAPRDGEAVLDFAVRAGATIAESVLPIQGPPGSGKTYCGSKMICQLLKLGRKVGVTANSHKVIRNLLDAVAKEGKESGVAVKLGHKGGEDADAEGKPTDIAAFETNEAARDALADGTVNVLGGTAWFWSREDMAAAVDVLFVDEAGQMALANVIAVSQAANSVVLLGDPQQLEQPRKGTHPDGVGISALEHVLAGHQTIPSDRGIFLPETWRLAPSITAFTSELFYEGRLASRPGLALQQLSGVSGLPASGLALIAVEHDGNKNWSNEEMDVVADLVSKLTQPGATWTDREGAVHDMRGEDILVVAPYNSQVTRLTERLAVTGGRVGTVDKFQGQEAPVVIYSMATSRPEDAPRGMEFLYSLNRLNVATSRAKCLAVLVASRRLFEPDCNTPRQMQLANGLCRYQEMASQAP